MIYVIEQPHRGPVKCWSARDEKELIETAYKSFDEYCYDVNDETVTICEPGNWGERTEFSPKDAMSEYEYACEVIAYDLSSCTILTSEEAKKFVEGNHHGNMVSVVAALKAEMEVYE